MIYRLTNNNNNKNSQNMGAIGESYALDFRMGNCTDCKKWTVRGNWKVRNVNTGEIRDVWLCDKCGEKLEVRVRKMWQNSSSR